VSFNYHRYQFDVSIYDSTTGSSVAGIQGAANPLGGPNLSSSTSAQPQANGTSGELAVGLPTGALPFQQSSILPARPNLPDDPVIPHNGFATVEEGEKAFMHLLRKAGVDAHWTWDQTMRAIITDPLYKALNTLAEKKAAWQKVRPQISVLNSTKTNGNSDFCIVYRFIEGEGARRARRSTVKATSSYPKYA
jgi:hypothetical protein